MVELFGAAVQHVFPIRRDTQKHTHTQIQTFKNVSTTDFFSFRNIFLIVSNKYCRRKVMSFLEATSNIDIPGNKLDFTCDTVRCGAVIGLSYAHHTHGLWDVCLREDMN